MNRRLVVKLGFVVASATVFSACPLFQKGTGSGSSGTGTSSGGGSYQEREAERGKTQWPEFVAMRNEAKNLSPSADYDAAREASKKFAELIKRSRWTSLMMYAKTLPEENCKGLDDFQRNVSQLFADTVGPWVKANAAKDPIKANDVLDGLYNSIKERPVMKEAADALWQPLEKIYASRVAARKYALKWSFEYPNKESRTTSCFASATKPGAAAGAINPQVRFDSDVSDLWLRCYTDKPPARLRGELFNIFVGPYRLNRDVFVDQVKRADMKLSAEDRFVDISVSMASIQKAVETAAKQMLPFEKMTFSLHTAKKTGQYIRQWDANSRVYIDSPQHEYETVGYARIEIVQK